MDSAKRVELIAKDTQEVLTTQDLNALVESRDKLKHYIGFEISGKVHIGTGLMTGFKIADFQKAKVDCSCFLATYHAWINNKLGGNLDAIRSGAQYFKEGLIAGLTCAGADAEKVKFVSSDELYHNNDEYWRKTIDVAKNMTVNRATRATSIMGRASAGEMPMAWLLYTPMQVADIFIQDVNIAHAGMDQRKAHVIAREVGDKLQNGYKPVAVHHHLLLGLQKPPVWPIEKAKMQEVWSQLKMSKSVPGSAVYIHDSQEEVVKKIQDAFCPEGEVEFNPVLDWAKYVVFRKQSELNIERPAKFGGAIQFNSYEKLEQAFARKEVHPLDLKKAVGAAIASILEPARKHFEKPKVRKLKEEMESLAITR